MVVVDGLLTRRHVAAELASCLRKAVTDEIATDYFGYLVRTVLVHGMAAAGQNLHLKAALHLAHGERAVQAIDAGQEQLLRQAQVKELLAQAREPAHPVLLRLGEINTPGVAAIQILQLNEWIPMEVLNSLLGRFCRRFGRDGFLEVSAR